MNFLSGFKIIFFCFFFFNISITQERVNRKKLEFTTVSNVISKAVGWSYNSLLGEWIDFENVISDNKDYKDRFKSLQGQWMKSRINQNFNTIQSKKLLYNDKTYFVLVIDKWSGEYEYPNIMEDWYSFRQTIGYVFTNEEFQKLHKIDGVIELKTKQVIKLGSKYERYDELKFLDLIQTELSTEKSNFSIEYLFPIMKSKEGLIRFYLPEDFSTFSEYNFDKSYFETEYDNFSKILID